MLSSYLVCKVCPLLLLMQQTPKPHRSVCCLTQHAIIIIFLFETKHISITEKYTISFWSFTWWIHMIDNNYCSRHFYKSRDLVRTRICSILPSIFLSLPNSWRNTTHNRPVGWFLPGWVPFRLKQTFNTIIVYSFRLSTVVTFAGLVSRFHN